MDFYNGSPVIPLTYTRMINKQYVTGLSVVVSVASANTNATLLAQVACSETSPGSGIYTYNWAHGLTQDTPCVVTYTVSGGRYIEYIYISGGGGGSSTGRSV